jgi:tRNA(Ser,Leu) C12 N-acetylase TAN1
MLLRCRAENEDAADAAVSRIIPAIPRKWEPDGFEGLIVISNEEHADFEDNMTKLYLSVVEIEFSVPVALEETDVPTVKARRRR